MDRYLHRVCRATSQLLNTLLLGGDTDETCSAHFHCLAMRGRPAGRRMRDMVDWMASSLGGPPSHCARSYAARVARAQTLKEKSCRHDF